MLPPTQKPKPFSQAEIAAILATLRANQHYAHYADFVEFRFGCGCRIEEAIGLKWKHLSGNKRSLIALGQTDNLF
jgi:integrase